LDLPLDWLIKALKDMLPDFSDGDIPAEDGDITYLSRQS